MEVTAAGIVFLLIATSCLLLPLHRGLLVLLASVPFGSSAVVNLPALGGASVLFPQACLVFLVARFPLEREFLPRITAAIRQSISIQALILFTVYAVASAYFLPRLFVDETLIYPLRTEAVSIAVPLQPTSTNLTQSLYMVGNVLGALAVFYIASYKAQLSTLRHGLFLLSAVHFGGGLLDLIDHSLAGGNILQPIRTANYAWLTSTEVMGFKRITGLFPEASSFAYFTSGILFYSWGMYFLTSKKSYAFLLVVAVLFMLFSTSSTAYVVFAFFGLFVLGCMASAAGNLPRSVLYSAAGVYAICLAALAAYLIDETAFDPYVRVIDQMVIGKQSSASGIERMTWNAQALSNFTDTYGIGIGLGSGRSSSWLFTLASNLGAVGFLLFGVFAGSTMTSVWTHRAEAMQVAATFGMIGLMVAATVSGSGVDLGLLFFVFAGAALARPVGRHGVARGQIMRRPALA